jgi:branched-chain amino acid transport system permease protein
VKELLEVLISGAMLGAVYSVNAIGLSLVYGVTRVFNFAYGAFFTWGAYIAWLLSAGWLGLPYPLVFVISGVVLFGAGMGLERLLVRPLRWRSDWKMTTMITTLGLAIVLENVARIAFGPLVKQLPPLVEGSFDVLGLNIRNYGLVMVAVALISMIVLDQYLNKARNGQAMQAVAQDMTGAQIVGTPLNRIFAYAFGASAVMAGISGILLAPVYLISPASGWVPFFKAFVIVVMGGLGSVKGAVLAAFILGVGEALVTWQFGAVWTMAFWFVTLIVVLVAKPNGLFGKWS